MGTRKWQFVIRWVKGKGITNELPVLDKGLVINAFRYEGADDFSLDLYPGGNIRIPKKHLKGLMELLAFLDKME